MSFFTTIRSLWIAIGILVLINLFSVGWMWMGHKRHFSASKNEFEHLRSANRLQNALHLNREQKQMFQEVQRAHKEEIRAERKQLQQLKQQLSQVAFQDSVEAEMESLYSEIGNLQANIERSNFAHLKELFDALDKEQQIKFRKVINSWARQEPHKTKKRGPNRKMNRRKKNQRD